MKSIALLAFSAAAIIGAGTITASAQGFHRGGFHGGGFRGAAFQGGGFHGGGFRAGGFRSGGFNTGLAGARFGTGARFGAAGFGTRIGTGSPVVVGSQRFAHGNYYGGNWRRYGGWGRGFGYGLAGVGLGYGLGYGGWGYDDYAYNDPTYYGGYDSGYGNGYGSYAYDPDYAGAPYSSGEVIQTGRSAVSGGLGKYCTTPVKSCLLYNPSNLGADCSCKVTGGRSGGQVTP